MECFHSSCLGSHKNGCSGPQCGGQWLSLAGVECRENDEGLCFFFGIILKPSRFLMPCAARERLWMHEAGSLARSPSAAPFEVARPALVLAGPMASLLPAFFPVPGHHYFGNSSCLVLSETSHPSLSCSVGLTTLLTLVIE